MAVLILDEKWLILLIKIIFWTVQKATGYHPGPVAPPTYISLSLREPNDYLWEGSGRLQRWPQMKIRPFQVGQNTTSSYLPTSWWSPYINSLGRGLAFAVQVNLLNLISTPMQQATKSLSVLSITLTSHIKCRFKWLWMTISQYSDFLIDFFKRL